MPPCRLITLQYINAHNTQARTRTHAHARAWRCITFSNSCGPSWPLASHSLPSCVMLAKSESVMWMCGWKSCARARTRGWACACAHKHTHWKCGTPARARARAHTDGRALAPQPRVHTAAGCTHRRRLSRALLAARACTRAQAHPEVRTRADCRRTSLRTAAQYTQQ